jgi:preprotein translocase subunit Sec61beta
MSDVKNSGLATGLVSYWEFEEASGTRVDSHGSNDFTDNNTVGQGTGKQGSCADFEASNSEYLSKSLGSTGLELTTSFSVAFWYKPEVVGLQAIYQSGTNSNFWVIQTFQGKIFFTEDNIADYTTPASVLTAGTWVHVVVTKDGDSASNLKIYINGSLNSTHSCGTVSSPTGTARVGAYGTTGSPQRFLDGLLDETGVWSRALTSTEVSTLYNSGSGIPYDAGGGGGAVLPTYLPMGL